MLVIIIVKSFFSRDAKMAVGRCFRSGIRIRVWCNRAGSGNIAVTRMPFAAVDIVVVDASEPLQRLEAAAKQGNYKECKEGERQSCRRLRAYTASPCRR